MIMQELLAKKMIMMSSNSNILTINTSKENKNSNKNEDDQDHDDQDHDDQEVALPGFRFHPTDQELVGIYLRRKVEKKPISIELIKQIDIYKYDPWDLPKIGNVGDKEWYFFCLRGRKYRNSVRPNRVTGSGFWKATGIDKPIYSVKEPHGCVGLKKSLVYYRGSAGKGTKTDWMMHEFRLPPTNPKSTDSNYSANAKVNNNNVNAADIEAEVWTLCRIFKRIPSYKKYNNVMIPKDHTINDNNVMKENTSTKSQSISSISTTVDDSNSKTCSLETDYVDPYHCRNKRSSKPVKSDDHDCEMLSSTITDHGSWFTLGQYYDINHVPHQLAPSYQHHQHQHDQLQAPVVMPGSNYPIFNVNPNTADHSFFMNESWDELSPVVQFAVDRHDQS